MKTFPKRNFENSHFSTLNVLTQVCSHPGAGQSLNVDQLRKRIKILDAVEKEGDAVELDAKLHEELVVMLNNFQFATAHRDLLTVIDDVMNAQSVQTH